MKYLLFTSALCFLFSCVQPQVIDKSSTVEFFDTAAFLTQFRSAQKLRSVTKSIRYGSEISSSEISDYDITDDLKVIEKVNLNNPNWYHRYQIDTVAYGHTRTITYLAQEPDLKIRTFSIECDSLYNVLTFEGEVTRDAIISKNKRRVIFSVDEGYSINTKSQMLFGEEKETEIKVKFNT